MLDDDTVAGRYHNTETLRAQLDTEQSQQVPILIGEHDQATGDLKNQLKAEREQVTALQTQVTALRGTVSDLTQAERSIEDQLKAEREHATEFWDELELLDWQRKRIY